jgi:hypothetical protein
MSYREIPFPASIGGTGLTSAGSSGNLLTSNGTIWTSTAPPIASSGNAVNSTGSITIATGSGTVVVSQSLTPGTYFLIGSVGLDNLTTTAKEATVELNSSSDGLINEITCVVPAGVGFSVAVAITALVTITATNTISLSVIAVSASSVSCAGLVIGSEPTVVSVSSPTQLSWIRIA